jgi:NADPH-dependent curcumin reductase
MKMRNDVNRQWLLASRPEGVISDGNFRWQETPIPEPRHGQVLVRNLWLSFDPAQRGWMTMDTYVPMIPLGEVMHAASVGQVVDSRRPDYAPGELVQGYFGWQDYAVTDGGGVVPMRKLPPGMPPNLALSLFGITGLTAYFGVLDIGQVKEGETFVVSGAAGATGSIAGQIAKLKGCKVVGIAGGKLKCDWLLREAGFDGVIDYRAEDIGARLSAHCPKGIDVFYDNVGGAALNEALARINLRARIVLCGAISLYEAILRQGALKTPPPGPANYFNLTLRRGRMEGFILRDYAARFPEARAALAHWLGEGRLKQKEDVTEALENAPNTLARLFSGENFGKQLLKIADPPLAAPT